ncbi:DUF2934 domain-containing protein [Rhizobium sp. RM]|uniref:DUF2934 domain-containing protein n=1 Tax=Rhizobium sp. RM TaxID=2748079 RepID=UPI00110DB673|nr:DUF2934 domain-containing protein [Rhizobium sp. RM]NWJ27581.1 response regulator [Rhizobium sp. RM]TMV19965.1 response regulator [Rhizobium sp. Td3]
MDHQVYDWISRRAHEIWQNEGFPNGRDREHWSRAVDDWQLSSEEKRSSDVPVNSSRKVLVVDDEPLIRFATVDALEEAGFSVLEAANADEAIVLLNTAQIDAAVIDVNMPGSIDGLGLVDRLRKTYPNTRVLVTSGHVHLGPFDLASGVSFIPKPYDHQALIRMLNPLITE